LLNAAHDAGASRNAEAYRLVFEQNASLVKLLAERLAGLERAWHRLLMSQQPPAADTASENDSMAQTLLTMVAAQAAQGSNGKAADG
jgi:hypothetical protein